MIYYITSWKDDEVYDNIYKDCFFTEEEEAEEYCRHLNKDEDELKYEVFEGHVNKLRLAKCYRGGKNDSM